MSYHYPQIKDADQRLKDMVLKGISIKYDGIMKDDAARKAEEELEIIKKQVTAAGYVILYDVLTAVGARPEEFCFRGTAASSIVLYLLGLSQVDPLDEDVKLYPEFFYGINGDKAPVFELNVSKALHERIFGYFDNYPGENHIERKYDENDQLVGVYIGELSEKYARGELYFDTFYINFIPIDDKDSLIKEIISGGIIDACKPKTLREYVKCFGFSHDTDAWRDNAEVLMRDQKISLIDLIADREDVYEYMLRFGIDKTMAFSIAESVRKGRVQSKGWTKEMIDAINNAGIPDWYRDSCKKIKYLFPRAHAISFLKCYCKDLFG